MENEEEETILDSHEKLKNIIQNSELKIEDAVQKYLKEIKFPAIVDFKHGLEWFNVSESLSFNKHLKGKIVLLDFFTYCCINCMHILPDLKAIEDEFSVEDGLVVVGVHSAKFDNEKDSANILAAVQRYNIFHPVVNDKTCDMWMKCDVQCWPTLLLVGPNCKPIVMLMGEGHKENLRTYIRHALDYYKSNNLISNHSLPVKSAFHLLPELKGPLLFPGKIASFIKESEETIAISDTGNSRILIVQNGIIQQQIGGSKAGFKDGNFTNAQFNQPQGLTFQNEHVLFVADTENHAIRKVDLLDETVTTVAGNGVQSNDHAGGKIGRNQGISSPWDLCIYKSHDLNKNGGDLKDVLLIAMAGTHQIWAIFLEDIVWWKSKSYKAGTVLCIAGSGKEENRNNQYPTSAAFAQPSGLAISYKNKEVYIADSESSSIRKLSLIDGKVGAVVGGDRNPNNLFAFGDKDGILYEAKLQHSLGLTLSADENTLFVADTYNHKLKKINVLKNSITTIEHLGDSVDNKLKTFNEPAGLCRSKDDKILYLADTNNHAIKQILFDDKFNLKDVKQIDLKTRTDLRVKLANSQLEVITIKAETLNTNGGKLIIKTKFSFVKGLGFADGSPQKWEVVLPNPLWSCAPSSGNNVKNVDFVISAAQNDAIKEPFVDIVFNMVACCKETCHPKDFIVRQPIQFNSNGKTSLKKEINVKFDFDKIMVT